MIQIAIKVIINDCCLSVNSGPKIEHTSKKKRKAKPSGFGLPRKKVGLNPQGSGLLQKKKSKTLRVQGLFKKSRAKPSGFGAT